MRTFVDEEEIKDPNDRKRLEKTAPTIVKKQVIQEIGGDWKDSSCYQGIRGEHATRREAHMGLVPLRLLLPGV